MNILHMIISYLLSMIPYLKNISSITLTPERLRFLYGDLRFSKRDVEKLTGWSRSAIDTLLKNADLKLDHPTHRDMTSRDFTDLEQRLTIKIPERWITWSNRLAQVRAAFLAKTSATELDWTALDQFIAELPALQDQAEEERRHRDELYYLPHPIVLELMVKRSSDDLYLAKRAESGRLSLITGAVLPQPKPNRAQLVLMTRSGVPCEQRQEQAYPTVSCPLPESRAFAPASSGQGSHQRPVR